MKALSFYKHFLMLSLIFLVFSCGGGSDSSSDIPEKLNYKLTSNSSAGGSISPKEVTVQENNSQVFIITPEQGYMISNVSGCNGSLVENIFTIEKVVDDCSVHADFESIPTISGRVADGYLVGAKVCLDLNSNGRCNDDEPYAITADSGVYTLDVTSIDNYDLYPMVVEVPKTAIDEDTNQEVGKSYTLSAPAGKGEFISPITSLVNSFVNSGLTLENAESEVINQLSASSDVDVYEDYIQQELNGNKDYKKLHEIAGVVAQIFAENEESLSIVREFEPQGVVKKVEAEFSNEILLQLNPSINIEDITPQLSINLDEVILNSSDITLTSDGSTVQPPPPDDGINTTQSLTYNDSIKVEKGINSTIHINDGDKYSVYFTAEEDSDVFIYFTDPSNSITVALEKCNSQNECYPQGDMVRVRTGYSNWKVIERSNPTELPTGNLSSGTYKLTFSEYSFFTHNDIDISLKIIGYPHNRFRLDQKLLGPDVFIQTPVDIGATFDIGFGYSRSLIKNTDASNFQVVPIKLANTGGFSKNVQFDISSNFDSTKLQDIEVTLYDPSFLNFYEAAKESDYEFIFAEKDLTDAQIWSGRADGFNLQEFIFTNQNYGLDEYYLVLEAPAFSEIPFELGKENFFDKPLNSVHVKSEIIESTLNYNFAYGEDVYQIKSSDFSFNYEIYHDGTLITKDLWGNQDSQPLIDMISASKSLNRILAFNERSIDAFYHEYTTTIDLIDNRQLFIDIASTSASILTLLKKPTLKDVSNLSTDILFTVLKYETVSTVKDVGEIYMRVGYDLLNREYKPYKNALLDTIIKGGSIDESVYRDPDQSADNIRLDHISQIHRVQQVAEHMLRKGMQLYMSQTNIDAKWSDHIDTLIGMYFGAVTGSENLDIGKVGSLAESLMKIQGIAKKAQTGADFFTAILELEAATAITDILNTDDVLNYYSAYQKDIADSELIEKGYVNSPNNAPTANAGSDQSITEGSVVTLDGSASTDIEDDATQTILTYSWSQIDSSEYNIALSDNNIVNPTFTAPNVTEKTMLTFELTLTDSQLKQSSDSVDIYVEPTAANTFIFRGVEYGTVVSPITGKVWLDRNLGAQKVCTSTTDIDCYGDYFQWGRKSNGHEKPNSVIDYELVVNDTDQNDKFIGVTSEPWDWKLNRDDNLWNGSDALNNPCPVNFRVPTINELTNEVKNSYVFEDSFLKLPYAGARGANVIFGQGIRFRIWSSDSGGEYEGGLNGVALTLLGGVTSGKVYRSTGQSVRCIESENTTPDEEGLENLNSISLDNLPGHVVVTRLTSDEGLNEVIASVYYQDKAYQQVIIEERDQQTQEISINHAFSNTLFGWEVVGNSVEYSHTSLNSYAVLYNDGEINLNELNSLGTVDELYQTSKLTTDDLTGYRFTLLGSRQNTYFDFQAEGVLYVTENGVQSELLWEYDSDQRLFIGTQNSVNYIGTFNVFESGMTLMGGFLIDISATESVDNNPSFNMVWRVEAGETITIPTNSSYNYNYKVDWDDDSSITSEESDAQHTYYESGEYTVKITGKFPAIDHSQNQCSDSLIGISQWGMIEWESMKSAFWGCTNLNVTAIDIPSLNKVSDTSKMFGLASSFNGDISNWDVSNVTDMSLMFYGAKNFSGDLSRWDVSNVTTMERMFFNANAINSNLSNWNVGNVTDLSGMFYGARVFNSDISRWDLSNAIDLSGMFYGALVFNSNIADWDVSNVSDMSGMFQWAPAFNSDISNWDVSNVTDMNYMFNSASNFNGDVANWDVSNVTDMRYMFYRARLFNRDISNWNVSNVTDMRQMFYEADLFSGDLSNWNVSNVIEHRDFHSGSGTVLEPDWPLE